MFLHKNVQFKLDAHNLKYFCKKSSNVNFFSNFIGNTPSEMFIKINIIFFRRRHFPQFIPFRAFPHTCGRAPALSFWASSPPKMSVQLLARFARQNPNPSGHGSLMQIQPSSKTFQLQKIIRRKFLNAKEELFQKFKSI